MSENRYPILFEPVKIGPKTSKNRFYQVPHCTGAGHRWPQTMAALKGIKAEGGWGVVCTEECEIHPSSDLSSFAESRLWDDSDIPTHLRLVDILHKYNALAGIQLVHNGLHAGNRLSRTPALSPSGGPPSWEDPTHSRAMTKRDIRDLRKWFRDAAVRSVKSGYDIVYVYAGHNMTILSHFLQTRFNHRTDEYGGSLENRVRLLREVLEDTKEVVGNNCAVALRLSVDDSEDENLKYDSEGREIVRMLAELPDLWDVNVSTWENDSITSRFGESGNQEKYVSFVKTLTGKPVVGVGRFTAPDVMVSQIKRGILDFIGAARPSIADPFLPSKIEQGREDEIRECIGCNICTTGDFYAVPLRCTQNPTMGEEFRKGWHPEIIEKAGSSDNVLVVGAGPAGLECALALSKRGYDVVIAEKRDALGGRVLMESRLPGLSEWRRVIDHRCYMIEQKPNVATYTKSELGTEDILEYGFAHVVVSTGATWRTDFVGRSIHSPLGAPENSCIAVVSVGQLLRESGVDEGITEGHVVLFDDDLYYMGNVLAEKLRNHGSRVTYVTPSPEVAPYTHATLEQHRIQARLMELGVTIITGHTVTSINENSVTAECVYSHDQTHIECNTIVPVTSRVPVARLFDQLDQHSGLADLGIKTVTAIGDCEAPGTIATAVYSGHQYARQLDNPLDLKYSFRRENYQPVSS